MHNISIVTHKKVILSYSFDLRLAFTCIQYAHTDRINTWLKSNKLSLNVTKTHYMVFHRARRKVSRNKLFINNSVVTQVSCSKFLGIILDNKLNWNSHIAYIKNKIAKGMGILLKARKVLKRSVLHQLYYSYIFPYLRFTFCH